MFVYNWNCGVWQAAVRLSGCHSFRVSLSPSPCCILFLYLGTELGVVPDHISWTVSFLMIYLFSFFQKISPHSGIETIFTIIKQLNGPWVMKGTFCRGSGHNIDFCFILLVVVHYKLHFKNKNVYQRYCHLSHINTHLQHDSKMSCTIHTFFFHICTLLLNSTGTSYFIWVFKYCILHSLVLDNESLFLCRNVFLPL